MTAPSLTAAPVRTLARALSPVLSLLLVVLFFAALAPDRPVGLFDLRLVAVHTLIVGTAALGMTLVIMSGGIDLSIGSAVALASVAAALTLRAGAHPALALAAAIATGAACGLYNGILVTLLRLPPFIATLGTLGFFRGVAKWICGSRPVSADPRGLETWVNPIPARPWMLFAPGVWLMLALALLTAAAIRATVFGRHAVAIGSNAEAARRAGIPIARTRTLVYTVAGLFTGLAGLLQFARLTQGDPTIAVGLELDVIAAVVIGGASLSGGQGSIAGTLAGAVLMAYLRNRCTVLGWPNFVQEMIVGHIIIVAVAIDQWRLRRGRR